MCLSYNHSLRTLGGMEGGGGRIVHSNKEEII